MFCRKAKPLLAALATLACLHAAAEIVESVEGTYVVRNETLSILGKYGDYNVRDYTLDLQDGTTLSLDMSNNYNSVWPYIVITNGTVYFEYSGSSARPTFKSGMLCNGAGRLVVKGTSPTFCCGTAYSSWYPCFDIGNVSFEDAGGGTVSFVDRAVIAGTPTDPSARWTTSASSSAEIYAFGDDVFHIGNAAAWTMPEGAAVTVASADAIPANAEIVVPAGSTIGFAGIASYSFRKSNSWAKHVTAARYGQRVTLASETATFQVQGSRTFYDGVVAGPGSIKVVDGATEGNITVRTTANAQYAMPESDVRYRVSSADAISFVAGKSWANKVEMWIDPSRPETCRNLFRTETSDKTGKYDFYFLTSEMYPLVECIYDWRGTKHRHLRNRGFSPDKSQSASNGVHIFPYLVTRNGPAGLSYLSCGEVRSEVYEYWRVDTTADPVSTNRWNYQYDSRRRLYTFRDTTKYEMFTPKYVVMVFGSQYGGGRSLLGFSGTAFQRGTKDRGYTTDDPLTTYTGSECRIWIDGQSVEPTGAGLNGGWQVITIRTPDNLKFENIGWHTDSGYDCAGGQQYGEMLFFTEEITDDERVSIESYLARKWGLQESYHGGDIATVNLSGSGTVNLSNETARIEGKFSGAVVLDGGRLVVDSKMPYTADNLPAGRVGWFDPSMRSKVVTRHDEDGDNDVPNEVKRILDREGRTVEDEEVRLYSTLQRYSTLVTESRGSGPVMNWLDFANCYVADEGNTMLFNPRNDSKWTQSVRTAFVVKDSSRTGGSPVLDNIWGTSGKIRRSTSQKWGDKIWYDGTDASITGGEIHLNGVARTSSQGFSGAPEVFSFTTTEDYYPAYLGFFSCTHTDPRTLGGNADIIGESIFYSRELTGDERTGVEAYLMGKWLDCLPSGYADVRAATVSGSGSVVVSSLSATPKFAGGFEGEIAFTNGTERTLEVVLDVANGTMSGGLVAPNADVVHSWVGNPAISITVSGKSLVTRDFVVVDVKSVSPSVEWSVSVTPARRAENISVEQSADGKTVTVRYRPDGMLLLLK